MSYTTYLVIALGGALGALGRYSLSAWIHGKGPFLIPWGTFTVNILGSFMLGFITFSAEKLVPDPDTRLFLTVGFLGAFTTFSTFSLETLHNLQHGNWKIALFYSFGSLATGLMAVWLGFLVSQQLKI